MAEGMKKVVLFTTMNDLSTFGGIERQLPQEARYLLSEGHRVLIFSRPPAGALHISEEDGAEICHYPRAWLALPWLVKDCMVALWIAGKAWKLSRRERVYCISFGAMDGSGIALAKIAMADLRLLQRVPGPISYEVVHFTPAKLLRYRFYSVFYRCVEAFSYLVSDVVLPVSEFEEANVKSYNINGKRIKLLRCGIDSSKFAGKRGSARPITLPDGHAVVMFVGRLYEKNGPLVLARAIPRVLSSKPRTAFVFVGDGPMMEELKKILASYVDDGRVVFTGFRDDIPELHSQADVYVSHVSSIMDGIGQTAMEAMMDGLPVIVGKDRITQNLLVHGETALLVEKDNPEALASEILAVLDSPELMAKLGRKGRDYALMELSFESMMRGLIRELDG